MTSVVVVTIKLMPDSPQADLSEIEKTAKEKIIEFSDSKELKVEKEPVAFGLTAVNIIFVMDEEKGSTDPLEEKLRKIPNVNSAEVTDVRRAIG